MRRPRLHLVLCALAGLLACVWTLPAAALGAERPEKRTLYADGPQGRYLLGGQWLFRSDPGDQGLAGRWQRQTATEGWSPVAVPHAWNVGDHSNESMAGGIGWYRKDFELPAASEALAWTVRFESVNYRAEIWLNGRRVGSNRGAYIPFEFRLAGLKRRGVNRLVVRVDSRRRPTDFPPSRLNADGVPTGGWWNYGGILREVYLRRIDTVDWAQVRVRPELACPTCAATVRVRAVLRNVTPRARRVRVTGHFGVHRLRLGTRTVGANGSLELTDEIRVARPRLWSPGSPALYGVGLRADAGPADGGRLDRVGGYELKTGIRSVTVSPDGRLLLNGGPTNLRGLGYHEDSKAQGFAVDNAFREWLIGEAKALGATMLRTHYPPHPYLLELADREGILIWHEIPVYAVATQYLKLDWVRQLAAKELRKGIEANQNHPSIAIWSIGNELSSKPGPVQGYYIRRAVNLAHALDPTRPVGYAVAGYPSSGCQTEYAPLDVIGINEYFGWYPGPGGQLFDRRRLSGFLDAVRQCYPNKALLVTEFGFEANRDGPVEEKGTWAFQQDAVAFHLGVHASKPWLSGSLYWALNEFRVRPGWDGGNPRPTSPIHQKGLVTYEGARKPAWAEVQRLFTATPQYAPAPSPAR